ncbi:uncharacterized protein GGS25DRAFT_477849, partial [Hypoxylon fragiforme]|uniref:uncharacterized protein n=1 Tax=Hypoxylon fragiforme TaxID=63214 RepID=UPI0020C6F136
MKLGVKWTALDDGFVELNPVTSYGQSELADLHAKRIDEYDGRNRKKAKSYAQDLANRVFLLKADIYNRVQHLMDDKIQATNKTPFRRREWRIVILDECEVQMTELLPERKKGIFRCQPEKPAMSRWFIVLRGQEVKTTKEDGGWRLFNRHSNPWWRIDARETQQARKEHRDHFEKVNRDLGMRRGVIFR